jgi:hypothetical protein
MENYDDRGVESFQSTVNSQLYVDKTWLLEYLNSIIDSE